MQPGPGPLEQARVCRVTDQDVAEGEVIGRARLRPADELFVAQRGERVLEVSPGAAVLHQHRYRAAGELQPDHRGRLHTLRSTDPRRSRRVPSKAETVPGTETSSAAPENTQRPAC